MDVHILQLIEGARQATGIAVVIDVFRAMTVECYLHAGHADRVFPVGDLDAAYRLRDKHPGTLLVGERHGKMCPGFDYGNSPSQLENANLTGRTVVHTTSAGTQGIANAVRADEVLGACLANAAATAAYIRSRQPAQVSLVCMGLEALCPTEEDTLCAEYIQSLLEGKPLDLAARLPVLARTSGAKFFDPLQQDVFPTRDFTLCTQADRFPFALRVERDAETGLPQMRRVDV